MKKPFWEKLQIRQESEKEMLQLWGNVTKWAGILKTNVTSLNGKITENRQSIILRILKCFGKSIEWIRPPISPLRELKPIWTERFLDTYRMRV